MEDDILIDNYLKGLLSKEETDSFNERLKVDTNFNEKFKLEEQLLNALNEDKWAFYESSTPEVKDYKKLLEQADLQNLKTTLTEVNSEFKANSFSTNRKRIYYYLAAASIIIFVGFQFFFNQNISNQELYNDFIGLNDLPSLVSRDNELTPLSKAQEFFESKNYNEALTIFQSELNDNRNGDVLIYKGIAEMELEQYKEAETTFNNLINSDLLDAEKGYWYTALLFLKQNKVEKVRNTLNLIVNKGYFKSDSAIKLLHELE